MNPLPSEPVDGEPRETTPGPARDERLGKVLTTRAIVLAGLVVVVLSGGMLSLLLAARRQRLGELELRRKEHELAQRDRAQEHTERVAVDNREHQLRLAEDARTDAVERRITELYTKAADQLGSEKTPVRLAGLYALERLAQNTPGQRQVTTFVSV